MKEIPLTQGKVTLVDDVDYDYLMQWKWHAFKSRSTWYASRSNNPGKPILMHRALLGDTLHEKQLADHENGDGLDNQRLNLRAADHTKNGQNRRPNKNSRSGLKGVFPKGRKWLAVIVVEGRAHRLGRFSRAIDAAVAYDEAAQRYFGEFARLNFSYDPACFI